MARENRDPTMGVVLTCRVRDSLHTISFKITDLKLRIGEYLSPDLKISSR